jgi:hypothetical protein
VALASIGFLTRPLMSRSIVIHMKRFPERRLFDRSDTSDFDPAYRFILEWVRSAVLNPKPKMPRRGVRPHGRQLASADRNCRCLLAGVGHTRARAAAVHFARAYRDEDIIITLLRDIRKVFDALGIDRITSEALVAALVAMADAPWSEWTGVKGDQSPRKLSQGQLASALSNFPIRPTSIRFPGKATTQKGYYRSAFEEAWAGYCDEAGTPEQRASNVRQLLRGAS